MMHLACDKLGEKEKFGYPFIYTSVLSVTRDPSRGRGGWGGCIKHWGKNCKHPENNVERKNII